MIIGTIEPALHRGHPLNTGTFYGPLSVRINEICSIADVMI